MHTSLAPYTRPYAWTATHEVVTSARRAGIIEQPIDAWWEPKNDEKTNNRTMRSSSYERRLCRFFFRFRTKRRNLYRRCWSSKRRRFVVSKVLWALLIFWNYPTTLFFVSFQKLRLFSFFETLANFYFAFIYRQ